MSSTTQIRSQPNASPLVSPQSRTVILGLLLAIATLALYYPVHSHPFLNYDDILYYVTENDQLQAGLTWLTVKWALTTFEVGTWHPLTWLSHALDCQLFALDPSEQQHGNLSEAIARYKVAITMSHDEKLKITALNNLGRAYTDLGDEAHARQCFAAAASLGR